VHVELSEGQSVEIKDPDDLAWGERNALVRRLPDLKVEFDFAGRQLPSEPNDVFDAMNGRVVEVLSSLIESWTLGDMPVTADMLLGLPWRDGKILAQTAGEIVAVLLPTPTSPPSDDSPQS
jgi:hypothetical protein